MLGFRVFLSLFLAMHCVAFIAFGVGLFLVLVQMHAPVSTALVAVLFHVLHVH